MKDLSLYFHIPFCKSKCHYCDFVSFTNKLDIEDMYFNAILKELDRNSSLHGSNVKTIFFGGGSPSLVKAENIGLVLEKCRNIFRVSNNVEITIECNPESMIEEKLKKYKQYDINRLSIGLQAWQNNLLKNIGRIHTREQFESVFKSSREIGFNNINVDLIFSLPEQTLDDWSETLLEVSKLSPEHISCYSLTLEEGTILFEKCNSGKLNLPDDDADREMYYKVRNILDKYRYKQYEISNFSKPGFECKHNLTYWTFGEYLGIGVAAHSFYDGMRTENTSNIMKYINTIYSNDDSYIAKNFLSEEDKISEYIITGLRLAKGIDKQDFYNRFNIRIEDKFKKEINKFVELGLMKSGKDRLLLTSLGFDVSNSVLCEFV